MAYIDENGFPYIQHCGGPKGFLKVLNSERIGFIDFKGNMQYLQDRTKYDIDVFKSYFQRVDKVIEKGKITSDNQFNDINIIVDQLCQIAPVDNKKIEILNKLLGDYEQRKSRLTKKPTA